MARLSMNDVSEKLAAIQHFLYLESKLADEYRYYEWLDLFTEDAVYWMPTWRNDRETVSNVETEVNLFYLDYQGLQDYVARISSGNAPYIVNEFLGNL